MGRAKRSARGVVGCARGIEAGCARRLRPPAPTQPKGSVAQDCPGAHLLPAQRHSTCTLRSGRWAPSVGPRPHLSCSHQVPNRASSCRRACAFSLGCRSGSCAASCSSPSSSPCGRRRQLLYTSPLGWPTTGVSQRVKTQHSAHKQATKYTCCAPAKRTGIHICIRV